MCSAILNDPLKDEPDSHSSIISAGFLTSTISPSKVITWMEEKVIDCLRSKHLISLIFLIVLGLRDSMSSAIVLPTAISLPLKRKISSPFLVAVLGHLIWGEKKTSEQALTSIYLPLNRKS